MRPLTDLRRLAIRGKKADFTRDERILVALDERIARGLPVDHQDCRLLIRTIELQDEEIRRLKTPQAKHGGKKHADTP